MHPIRRTCSAKINLSPDHRTNCPQLATGPDNLCDEHRRIRERERGSSTVRGYDAQHRKARKKAISKLFQMPPQDRICPLCGEMMLRSDSLHLDHSTPLAVDPTSKGDRIVHKECNERRKKKW